MAVAFITAQVFKDKTGVSTAIDDKQITPMIKVAQDIFLMPALGSTLYNRLQTGKTNNNLNTNETNLINNYIIDLLVWSTMSYLSMSMGFQLFSKGFLQKTAENVNAPSRGDIGYIETYYSDMAEEYKQRLINYLMANKTLFAEYASPGCGWDVTKPTTIGYECPIYLGEVEECVPCHDPQTVDYSHPKVVSYKATGGEASFIPSPSIAGKVILFVSRAGVIREVVSTATSDTNELQIVGNVVTLPTGDAAMPGEIFKFFYI